MARGRAGTVQKKPDTSTLIKEEPKEKIKMSVFEDDEEDEEDTQEGALPDQNYNAKLDMPTITSAKRNASSRFNADKFDFDDDDF